MNDNASRNGRTPRRDSANREITIGDFREVSKVVFDNFLQSLGKRGVKVRERKAMSQRFYQVRNIDASTWGLFYKEDPDGIPQHWLGLGGYEAVHRNAAMSFKSPVEAREFRDKNFKTR